MGKCLVHNISKYVGCTRNERNQNCRGTDIPNPIGTGPVGAGKVTRTVFQKHIGTGVRKTQERMRTSVLKSVRTDWHERIGTENLGKTIIEA